MSPATAQHAALKILLEDVEPLLQKVDAVSFSLAAAQENMQAEVSRFGELVRLAHQLQPSLVEASKRLAASAARLEANQAMPATRSAPTQSGRSTSLLLACALSAFVGAVAVGGIAFWAGRDVWEQARIGRALQSAWPDLDATTRSRLQQRLGS